MSEVNLGEIILETLDKSDGYVTVPYLSKITGSSPEIVNGYIAQHPDKIRKSKIETDAGESLYMLNKPLSGIADAWHAFRFANAKKF